MDYRIAISPELETDPEEFVSAWNDAPECREIAAAKLEKAPAESFMDPGTVLAFLGGIAATVATDVHGHSQGKNT